MPGSCRERCSWRDMKRMQICFVILWMQISRICEQKNLSCRVIRLYLNLDFVTGVVVTAGPFRNSKAEMKFYHIILISFWELLLSLSHPASLFPTSCSSQHVPTSAYALRQTPTRYLVVYNKDCSIWSPDVSTLRNDLHWDLAASMHGKNVVPIVR